MVTHYRYEATVTRGETNHEVYLRLKDTAYRNYDDIIMTKSWFDYPIHGSPIAIFTFTRSGDRDIYWEHQLSRGSWEGRYEGLRESLDKKE